MATSSIERPEFTFTREGGESVYVGWYLMRFKRFVAAHEDREIRWCTFPAARQLVRFDLREILEAAEQEAARSK